MDKTRKRGLFASLAINGVKNNSKLYVPYMITSIGTIAVFYILYALMMDVDSSSIGGRSYLAIILGLGTYVIVIFGVLFLLYTNSFLIGARTKEFGLYNVLGMSKIHIAKIVASEAFMTGSISMIAGLLVGILFEKLVQTIMYKIINAEQDYSFHIYWGGIWRTLAFFGAIFALLMIRSVVRVYRLNTIDLMKNDKVGEKPPKANWLIALAGIIMLAVAYYISVTTKSPLSALTLFFLAVVLVILATYLIFIAGSVTLCRVLQKNKKYYYSRKHFVSLSQMVYRMKRNGAGLATICILSTMVLVMLSSTTCMYFGKEYGLNTMYPSDVMMRVYRDLDNSPDISAEVEKDLDDFFENAAKEAGYELENKTTTKTVDDLFYWVGDIFSNDRELWGGELNTSTNEKLWEVLFVPVSEYERLSGKQLTLKDDEFYIAVYSGKKKIPSEVMLNGEKHYKIVNNEEPDRDFYRYDSVGTDLIQMCALICNEYPDNLGANPREKFTYGLDLKDATPSEQRRFFDSIEEDCCQLMRDKNYSDDYYFIFESREENRADFYEMYGGMFFLGIVLSVMFTSALVLIIYYKQISEGYEDGSRYEIMKKVGMTGKDIRKNVNSQMKTVFYMPLIMAILHLAFAFPIIFRILTLFGLINLSVQITTAVVSAVLFGVLYTVVYNFTSNSYYKLVR